MLTMMKIPLRFMMLMLLLLLMMMKMMMVMFDLVINVVILD